MKTRSSSFKRAGLSRDLGSQIEDCYPFVAIVGQDEMKLALVLNVIDRSIGGVLMMGHRGTGKSTAVRALADLLPEISVVLGCAYNCDPTATNQACANCAAKLTAGEKFRGERKVVPVVDLPLGATEDRVCGSIDIERALKGGEKVFEPGLLARANRGFLYVDEVNLLEDHLVDLLLDVAVTGRNKVERENISIEHPASFVLIGSGNPEEGELRPQLLDRFGLYVEVKTENEPERRLEIVQKRDAFGRGPEKFRATFADEQEQLRRRITRARKAFMAVKVERSLLRRIVQLCCDLKIDGHRGELTIMRAARALAAFAGRKAAVDDDVRRVATMSLRHRLRRDGLDDTGSNARIEQALENVFRRSSVGSNSISENSRQSARGRFTSEGQGNGSQDRYLPAPRGQDGSSLDREVPAPEAAEVEFPKLTLSRGSNKGSSRDPARRSHGSGLRRTSYSSERGRYARAVAFRSFAARISIDATLRVRASGGATSDLRYKQFAGKHGTLFIFAIDASGSMALNRINRAKGAVLRLLRQSYINRDSVAVVTFRGDSAEVALPPSRSMLRARQVLDSLSIGGGTPLSAGLACALDVAKRAADSGTGNIALLLFTDGHANVPLGSNPTGDRALRNKIIESELVIAAAQFQQMRVSVLVVDTQGGVAAVNNAQTLAARLDAQYIRLSANEALFRRGENSFC